MPSLRALLKNKKGATIVEYGLIIAVIVLVMIAALQGVADATIGMWDDVAEKVTTAGG